MQTRLDKEWLHSPIYFEGLVRIHSIGDGSCFFHSILEAVYPKYWTMTTNQKKQYVMELRDELAVEIEKHYDKLSEGKLNEWTNVTPEYTLPSLQKELRSSASVDYIYIEFLSNLFNINIYVIRHETKDIVTMADFELLYTERKSIVLYYSLNSGHYDLVVKAGEKKSFNKNHPYIALLNKRYKDKTNWSKK